MSQTNYSFKTSQYHAGCNKIKERTSS